MGMESYNDSEFVIQLQNNNVKAFNQVYIKYQFPIYQNIFKLLKDPVESENILQEVFITLWEKRLTLDCEKPIANWLFVVSYNKSITYLKKALKEAMVFKMVENEYQQPDEVDSFLREAKLKLIDDACLNLSPQKRKVFDLCKLQGKTYEETAHELNISKYTVKEYLSTAVKNIKDYVEQHPDNHMVGIYLIVILKVLM
jgi:RNA polymerase sigma factor (sigma-70 family)